MQNNKNLLAVRKQKQEKVVHELIEKSRPTSPYNLLLIFSAVIVACGVLLANIPILIGGMLVTPLLTPILAIALGITCGEIDLIRRSSVITAVSILIIIIISMAMGFFFPTALKNNVLLDQIKPDMLYFVVALVSGAAATFAWTEPDINDALPGVAVAVSIVPPLSILGIGLSHLSADLIRISTVIFLWNFMGIVIGSLIVFSLMQFYKAKRTAHQHVVQEQRENEKAKVGDSK